MGRWVRTALIAVVTVSGLLMLVLVGGVSYLKTPQAQKRLQQHVDRILPGAVRWGNLDFSLLAGRVDIRDLLVEGPEQERLAGLDHLRIDVSWRALLKGVIAVKAVRVEAPWADLAVDARGRLNLMGAFPEPEPRASEPAETPGQSAVEVVVDRFRLTNGVFSYKDPEAPLAVSLEGVSMQIDALSSSTPTGRLRIGILGGDIESPAFTGPIDQFEAAADLNADRLSSVILALSAGKTHIRLAGAVDRLGDDPVLDLTLDADLALAEIRDVLNLDPELSGSAAMHLSAKGPLSDPDATVKLDYGGGLLGGFPVDRIDLHLSLADRHLHIAPLSIISRLGTLSVQGDADLAAAFPRGFLSADRALFAVGLKGDLALQAPDLAALLSPAGIEGVAGGLSANLSMGGSPDRPTATLAVSGKRLVAPGAVLGDVLLEADLDQSGTVAISTLTLKNRGSRATVRGSITLLENRPGDVPKVRPGLPVDLALALENVAPGDFLEIGDIKGRFAGTVKADGPARSPDLRADISGEGLAVGSNRIGDVDARITMTEGRVGLSPVAVVNGESRLTLTGTVGVMTPGTGAFSDDPTLDIRLSGDPVRLEDFVHGMTGTFSLAGEIGGSVARPRGTITVDGGRLELGDQPLDGVTMNARMDGGTIRLDRFRVAVTPEEFLDGQGIIDLDRSTYEMRVTSTGISLGSIPAAGGPDRLAGTVSLDLFGKGSFADPRAEGRVAMTDIRINRKPMADFRIQLALADRTARIWGRPGFDLNGRYHLDRKTFSAVLGFDRTDLAPYFRIAGLDDLTGRIDGTLTAEGKSDAWETIRVAADLRDLSLVSGGRPLLAGRRIEARFEEGRYTLPATEIRLLEDGRITLKGAGDLAGRLALSADGRIPLAVIRPFLDAESDPQGVILLAAEMSGTLEKPELQGRLTLDRLGMNLPGLDQRLHDVTGRVVLSSGALSLENVTGRIDDGSFGLDGRVDLEAFAPVRVDLQASARRLPIEIPDTLSLLLDSRLNLSGTPEKSMLSGEIVLLEGRYTRDVELNLLQGMTTKTRETAPEPDAGETPFLSDMALDIVVKRREPFVVENNVADMRLSPDLRVLGTAQRPVISGRAAVDEGVVTYQKRAFEIRRGVVDFLNPYRTEPTIDIEGEVEVRDWIVTLKIGGTPDNLRFELTSNPAEEHGDIISLLVFGKTLKEMRRDDGGSGFSARGMLGEILSDTLSSGVRDATGLDIVEVELSEAGNGGDAEDIRVTLGKELSRRITVKYGADIKNGVTVQKVISEYRILEELMVSAFQDTAGNFGGALTFRMEFR
ncbi:translocation/assembly module TamB domain-containing protein [Desulfococcus multivorans]|uniref:Translocation and assembly module TamB C-terminal domain-containing protein n=2 Tax=Desulfococcus multivorans TaxID=897 RepID=S7TGF8_DESML|nr:translocation/assembly module TamB domain-containing protein [Desulfococcus multivorans]AQV02010.1 hypothetical protein B2D07_15405 [Desulfococcus multivorans]EPR35846.1 protein of unknown function DUF490 [Desulfococcus multivorans DSM 2059]SJZ34029.1 Autotransporter translocation and assembly factor TamB [Desulfococcus multivorans DSM 2059]